MYRNGSRNTSLSLQIPRDPSFVENLRSAMLFFKNLNTVEFLTKYLCSYRVICSLVQDIWANTKSMGRDLPPSSSCYSEVPMSMDHAFANWSASCSAVLAIQLSEKFIVEASCRPDTKSFFTSADRPRQSTPLLLVKSDTCLPHHHHSQFFVTSWNFDPQMKSCCPSSILLLLTKWVRWNWCMEEMDQPLNLPDLK
jgi:hypothetical protein